MIPEEINFELPPKDKFVTKSHFGNFSAATEALKEPRQKLRIAIISDFFVPNLGGVEMHMYNVAQCLQDRGHKVIVITSTYSNQRTGIRFLTNGLKVYHCPTKVLFSQTSVPDFFAVMSPCLRTIFIREKIDIVHGQQASAVMMLCGIHCATQMGLRTVFTDHSLFQFSDAASIHLNKVLKWDLEAIDACIAVSHCNKENLALRACVPPDKIYVIPNSVDTERFTPNPSLRSPINTVNIVCICRLTFRKGVDLMVLIIPEIIRKYPNVHFIIGGDGPKMPLLQEMRDKYNIADKVELLGSLHHSQVRDVLCRGHIFLNTSLTEAFCIAILEAASCGLLCVSTNVGGIPEVLPPDMIWLSPARPKSLIQKLEVAISKHKTIQSTKMHETVKKLYSWHNVAERTEKVYYHIMEQPKQTALNLIKIKLSLGPFAGFLSVCLMMCWLMVFLILEYFWPAESIDIAEEFNQEVYKENPEKFGDHQFDVVRDTPSHKDGGQKNSDTESLFKKRTNNKLKKTITMNETSARYMTMREKIQPKINLIDSLGASSNLNLDRAVFRKKRTLSNCSEPSNAQE